MNLLKYARMVGLVSMGTFGVTAAVSGSDFQVGVGLHIGYPDAATESALRDLQASFRTDVLWSRIEANRDVLQMPDAYRDLEAWTNNTHGRGLRPILILDYGNEFYDGGGQIVSAAGVAAFTRYARFVAKTFKGRVDQFEVWNEWHLGTGIKNKKNAGDPQLYASLLRETSAAVKSENPGAVVLGGGTGVSLRDFEWLREFARSGGLQSLDGYSVHPYVHCNAGAIPKPPVLLANDSGVKVNYGTYPAAKVGERNEIAGAPEEAIAWLDSLRSLLDEYSPTRVIPVYVTEIGWPTHEGKCGISDLAAAAYLQRFVLLARTRPWIRGVWWYDLMDDGTDATKREHRFGLMKADAGQKAAFEALEVVRALVGSPAEPTSTVGANDEMIISGRTADGKRFYAAWLPTSTLNVRSPWPFGAELLEQGFQVLDKSLQPRGSEVTAMPVLLVER